MISVCGSTDPMLALAEMHDASRPAPDQSSVDLRLDTGLALGFA